MENKIVLSDFHYRLLRTHSGTLIDVFAPRIEEFHIEDIAHSLSQLCRYGGHCEPFYSVAQHSIACSYLVSPKNAMCALLHDATEAYLVDIPKPIKKQIHFYNELENELYQSIAKRFNLPTPIPEEVHKADNDMLTFEWFYFMEKDPKLEHRDFYKKHFQNKSIKNIKNQFIKRYEFLLTQQG